MSETTPPVADAPAQQATHNLMAERAARAQHEAAEDATRKEADAAADAKATADAAEATPAESPDAIAATRAADAHAAGKPADPADEAAAEREKLTADAEAHAKSEADAAEKAEAEKAKRAEAGVTGATNGDPAGIAFAPRIADAKFSLRNQGMTEVETLFDDMLAALQRLEAKAMGT